MKGVEKELLVFVFCTLLTVFLVKSLLNPSPVDSLIGKDLQILSSRELVFENSSGNFLATDHKEHPSVDYPQFSPFFFQPIAINSCDKTLLMSVRGIGPGLAKKILERRMIIGEFKKAEDLLLVHGIGPIRLSKLAPYFSFSTYHE